MGPFPSAPVPPPPSWLHSWQSCRKSHLPPSQLLPAGARGRLGSPHYSFQQEIWGLKTSQDEGGSFFVPGSQNTSDQLAGGRVGVSHWAPLGLSGK